MLILFLACIQETRFLFDHLWFHSVNTGKSHRNLHISSRSDGFVSKPRSSLRLMFCNRSLIRRKCHSTLSLSSKKSNLKLYVVCYAKFMRKDAIVFQSSALRSLLQCLDPSHGMKCTWLITVFHIHRQTLSPLETSFNRTKRGYM